MLRFPAFGRYGQIECPQPLETLGSSISAYFSEPCRGGFLGPLFFPILSATHNNAHNPFRITSFADPHPLTSIESYSCRNRGVGYPSATLHFYTRSAIAPSIRWKKNSPPSTTATTMPDDASSNAPGGCPCPVSAHRNRRSPPPWGSTHTANATAAAPAKRGTPPATQTSKTELKMAPHILRRDKAR